jgi:hypothetical protein
VHGIEASANGPFLVKIKSRLIGFARSFLPLVLVGCAFPVNGAAQSPQASQLATGELTDGTTCISFVSGIIRPKGIEKRTSGRGKKQKNHFYLHGKEVDTFIQPVQVMLSLFPGCKEAASVPRFPWSGFASQLEFTFRWESNSAKKGIVYSTGVKPSSTSVHDSVWQEQSPEKRLLFTLPAETIPVDIHLVVEVSIDRHRIKTFALSL